MNREELIAKYSEPQRFGSGGFIRLVDCMGDDAAVVQAARISYGDGTKSISEDRELIRYLLRHKHTTPFEMCEIKFHMRIPMDVCRQLIRHRTANVNEYSTRYSIAIEDVATTNPGAWRLQSSNNKQGSDGFLTEWPAGTYEPFMAVYTDPGTMLSKREAELHELAREVYDERLAMGVAREQARKDLPLSTYTELYWKIDLHNLLHFLRLRLDSHAQQEIRELSQCMANVVRDWVPVAWQAFEDYVLGAVTFSRTEMLAIAAVIMDEDIWVRVADKLNILTNMSPKDRAGLLSECGLTSKTERIEFVHKLKSLFATHYKET